MHEDVGKQCLVVFMSSNVKRVIILYSREARDWFSSSPKWAIAMSGSCSSLTTQGDGQVLTEDKSKAIPPPQETILQTRCSSRQNDLKLQDGTEAITAIIYMLYMYIHLYGCTHRLVKGFWVVNKALTFLID